MTTLSEFMAAIHQEPVEVWVVGRYPDDESAGMWELQGIFTDRDTAWEFAEPGWWLGPVPLNTPLPTESVPWPQVKYVLKFRKAARR